MSGRLASRWRGRHDPLMEVADGIFKIDGVRIANVYLVATEDGLLLVDTGMPGNARRILSFIDGIGRKPSALRDIVVTHCDIDHVGSVAELKRLTGARVAIHELDAPVLSGEQRPQKGGLVMVALYRLLRFRPVAPDLRLRDGDTIGGLHVMHVPGHTAGSIALVRDDGVVFSGDALLSDKDGNVLPPDPRLAFDRARALASAAMITARHATLLLTGHGAPVSG
jgi:hydroxyacylglutathione hydrolase